MAKRAAPKEDVSIVDLFRKVSSDLTKQSNEPNILAYEPHNKQQFFHESMDRKRLYLGGNRSGKTFGAVVEDIWWATKTHPYRKMPHGPIRGRVVAVDKDRGVRQILLPIFKRLLVPSMLINGNWEDSWQDQQMLLTFANGSTIEFMSYEQDVEKFAGTSRHFVHYDEEPPKGIYTECQARVVDTKGSSWISMTPVEGATWVFSDMYERADEAGDKEILNEESISEDVAPVWRSASEGITIIEVGMNENPHIDAEAREDFLRDLDPDERKARSKGTFVTVGGKVFKSFARDTHTYSEWVSPAELQRKGWQIYTTCDYGWTNPTAWLWMAVAPESLGGKVLTFGEHYKAEMTIEEHSEIVHRKEAEWSLNTEDIIRTGDPAMHQTNGIQGISYLQMYANCGLYIYTDSVPRDRTIGIQKMQQYFRIDDNVVSRNVKSKWEIHDSCSNLINELRKLRWENRATKKARDDNNRSEQIHKKDDHAFDAAKYFATFLPDLAPEELKVVENGLGPGRMMYDQALIEAKAAQTAYEESQGMVWDTVVSYN